MPSPSAISCNILSVLFNGNFMYLLHITTDNIDIISHSKTTANIPISGIIPLKTSVPNNRIADISDMYPGILKFTPLKS